MLSHEKEGHFRALVFSFVNGLVVKETPTQLENAREGTHVNELYCLIITLAVEDFAWALFDQQSLSVSGGRKKASTSYCLS